MSQGTLPEGNLNLTTLPEKTKMLEKLELPATVEQHIGVMR